MTRTYTVTLGNGCGEVKVQGAPRIGDRQGISTGRLDFFGTVRSFTSGEGMEGRLSSGIVWEATDVLVASFAPGCWTHFVLNGEAAEEAAAHAEWNQRRADLVADKASINFASGAVTVLPSELRVTIDGFEPFGMGLMSGGSIEATSAAAGKLFGQALAAKLRGH